MSPRSLRTHAGLVAIVLSVLSTAPLPAEEPGGGTRIGREPLAGVDTDQADPAVHWAAHLESFPVGEISPDEAEALARASRLEKLAHELYRALGGDDHLLLVRIGQVERLHRGAVEALYRRHDLEDGIASLPPGAFDDADLEALYRRLLPETAGGAALLEAAAEVEEMEILALGRLRDVTNDADIRYTAEALLAGSRNHLRLLAEALEAGDASLRPRHLDPEAAEEILDGKPETGPLAGPLMDPGRRPEPEDLFEALEESPDAAQ